MGSGQAGDQAGATWTEVRVMHRTPDTVTAAVVGRLIAFSIVRDGIGVGGDMGGCLEEVTRQEMSTSMQDILSCRLQLESSCSKRLGKASRGPIQRKDAPPKPRSFAN